MVKKAVTSRKVLSDLPFEVKTEWDLKGIFPTDEAASDKIYQEKTLAAVQAFCDKWRKDTSYLEDPKVFLVAIREYEQIVSEYAFGGKFRYYFHLKFDLYKDNEEIGAKYSQAKEFGAKITTMLLFFANSVAKIPAAAQGKFLKAPELLKYRHFLEKQFEMAKHILSEGEEKILALKKAGAYENWTEMVEKFVGKEKRGGKSFEELVSIASYDKQKKLRDRATKQVTEIVDKVADVAVEELNSVLLDKKIDDELKNFARPEEASLLGDDIDFSIVEAMVKAVSDANQLSQEFYRFRAKLFGVNKMTYNEKVLPFGVLPDNFSFEEAVAVVDRTFGRLDKEFQKIYRETLARGGVDVFPKKGKRGGGYCIGWTLNFDSRILMNFTGKLNDVRTLAHEFGHLFNNELMKTKVSEVNYLTPLSTAEVASTFTEDFALEEISENLQSDEGKLSVLMARLIDDVSSIFRQVACFRLEQELHSKYRLKGFLSKRTIGDLFIKHMGNYLGEAVDMAGFENWWVYWHHIRYYFYVYSYASGQLISKALQVKVRKDQTFMEKYKEFLATGGLQSPKEAFLRIGIDITDANFWKLGLEEFERNFSEAKRLAKKLGKI